MSPERSTTSGPLTRALYEALETVAARDQVQAIVELSLRAAGLDEVPEDLGTFRELAGEPLRHTVSMVLGRAAAESVIERLELVLRNATPYAATRSVSGRVPKALFKDDDRDDPSGMRPVESAGAAAVREMHEAPTQPPPPMSAPPPSAKTNDARVSRPQLRRVREPLSLAPPRALPLDVLVITLDDALLTTTSTRLRGRARVVPIGSVADLALALADLRGQRLAVIIDTALSSINVPTFATLSAKLPPHAVVVLWGIDAAQKHRLEARFPQVRAWIAGGTNGSPADLLLDR